MLDLIAPATPPFGVMPEGKIGLVFMYIHRVSLKKNIPVFHVMQEHKLGEVENETTPSSQYISGIFLPKIIKIGQHLTKLRLMKDGDVF